jgi:hypothetical protein
MYEDYRTSSGFFMLAFLSHFNISLTSEQTNRLYCISSEINKGG